MKLDIDSDISCELFLKSWKVDSSAASLPTDIAPSPSTSFSGAMEFMTLLAFILFGKGGISKYH